MGDATTTAIDWSAQFQDVVHNATGIVSDNVVYLLALPAAFVGYKIVRKLIAKVG